jgi:hypothetical protein
MGSYTDADALMDKALREVRNKKILRVLWFVVTSAGTIVGSTWAVSWKMNNYVHEAERRDEKLRGDMLVIAKAAEKAEKDSEEALKEAIGAEREARDAKAQADKAMLYAQLTKRERQ